MSAGSPLKQLSLFLVLYDENDPLSHVFAWSTLIPIFIVVGHASVLLFRRELFSAFIFAGYLVSEFINTILKDLIKQSRPPNSYKPGWGMPSDHAQFMAYALVMTLLTLYYRVKMRDIIWKYFIGFVVLVLALVVSVGRVYAGVHTEMQVYAGFLIGIAFGAIWFTIGHTVLSRYVFPWVVQLPICRYFMIRDSTHVENVLLVEYNATSTASMRKQKTG